MIKIIRNLYQKKYSAEEKKIATTELYCECKKISQEIILLSDEGIFGNPNEKYNLLETSSLFYKKIFQNVEIILVLRNQTDWLLSLYKQSIHVGDIMSINQFLNYRNKIFKEKTSDDLLTVNALSYDYSKIIQNLSDIFSENNLHVLFFEDLKINTNDFFRSIEHITNCKI